MILRPLERAVSTAEKFISAWEAVERTQREDYQECRLITQPSHAVLAAELAREISSPAFPALDSEFLKAIALHDAGWGIPDAQAITKSRSVQRQSPQSFIAMPPAIFLAAWEKSIETCEPVSPAGGYAVSRHFYRLGESRLHAVQEKNKADRQKLEAFTRNEERRQKKLAGRQQRSLDELEKLTDVLQFCDLLSLYLCSGAAESVVFPEYFGVMLRITNAAGTYVLDQKIVKSGVEFAVAALRYPATKEESSREIRIRMGK
jgi:hypothetical protein